MSVRDVQWGPLAQVSTQPHPALSQNLVTAQRQEQAINRLYTKNTKRAEAWRYTSLKALQSLEMSESHQESSWQGQLNGSPIDEASTEGVRLYRLSDLASATLDTLEKQAWAWIQEQMESEESMYDLQSLHYQDGLLVIVEPECVAGSLQIEHVIQANSTALKLNASNLWVYLSTNASLQLIESFSNKQDEEMIGQHMMMSLSAMHLSKGSCFKYTRIQETTRQSQMADFHLGRVTASLEADANLTLISLNLGSDLCRLEIDVSLDENGAFADLSGLYLGSNQAQLDQHLTLRHRAAQCKSIQRFKGALGGQSKGIFTGRVIVSPGASSTHADQNNPNLLLSDLAKAVTRPQLEIYNDDVECSHGATVGQLDEDALFYLKARGLNESEALRALTAAFVGEIRELLTNDKHKESVDIALRRSLGLVDQKNAVSEEWIDWEAIEV